MAIARAFVSQTVAKDIVRPKKASTYVEHKAVDYVHSKQM